MRTAVATRYIPTVGEHAGRALASFEALHGAASLADPEPSAAARMAAVELVRTCLALLRKFPMQARLDFASALPFTRLELELLNSDHFEDLAVVDAITQRLLEWVQGSPLHIDDVDVHAAEFLVRLAPLLDLWNQRQHAIAAAARFGLRRPSSFWPPTIYRSDSGTLVVARGVQHES